MSDAQCAIGACPRPVHAKGLCRAHYARQLSGADLEAPVRGYVSSEEPIENILESFSTLDGSIPGCLEWARGRFAQGYGCLNRDRKPLRVHVVAWELAHGPIEQGLVVRHKCDNPPCFRLDHLELGTHLDNARDRVERDRAPKGEAHPLSGLTESDVLEVFNLRAAGLSARRIANKVGTSRQNVGHILNRRRWGHVEIPSEILTSINHSIT